MTFIYLYLMDNFTLSGKPQDKKKPVVFKLSGNSFELSYVAFGNWRVDKLRTKRSKAIIMYFLHISNRTKYKENRDTDLNQK